MKIIDTKGQLCPLPLIATKKALKEIRKGESFKVITDNQTSFGNLSRFLKDNKAEFYVEESEGIWTLTVTRKEGDTTFTDTEEYCVKPAAQPPKGNYIIALASDKMGDGDDEIGHLMMKNFIKTIKELDNLPRKIVIYSKGVTLVSKESPVVEHLKEIENKGVEVLLCGTSVKHYSLEGKTGAGTISNMLTISGIMASAGNIIRP